MGRVLNRITEASDVEWNIKFSNGYDQSVPIPTETTTLAVLPPCFLPVDLLLDTLTGSASVRIKCARQRFVVGVFFAPFPSFLLRRFPRERSP
jgi:hypothetical protein